MPKHSPHLYLLSPMLGLFALNSCQIDPEYFPWILQLKQSLQYEKQPLRHYPVKQKKATPLKPQFSALKSNLNIQARALRPCFKPILNIGQMLQKQRHWSILRRKICPSTHRF